MKKNLYTVTFSDNTLITITGEEIREEKISGTVAVNLEKGTLYLDNIRDITVSHTDEDSVEYDEAVENTEMLVEKARIKAEMRAYLFNED